MTESYSVNAEYGLYPPVERLSATISIFCPIHKIHEELINSMKIDYRGLSNPSKPAFS